MPTTTVYIPTKDLSSRLIDMTLGEALEIAKPLLEQMMAQVVRDNLEGKGADVWGYGLDAIQDVFKCSSATAVKLHYDKRYFGKAIFNEGRKIMVNKTKLLKLKEEEGKKRPFA